MKTASRVCKRRFRLFQDLGERLQKDLQINGLCQMAVHSGSNGLLAVFIKGIGRHGKDGDLLAIFRSMARICLVASWPFPHG